MTVGKSRKRLIQVANGMQLIKYYPGENEGYKAGYRYL